MSSSDGCAHRGGLGEPEVPDIDRFGPGSTVNGVQRFFRAITSGWLIAVIAVALFVYACFTLLAPWQLGKNEDLQARNSQLRESIEADPVPLAELTTGNTPLEQSEWHLVTTTGRYLPEAEVLLRQRAVDGKAVYQVFAAFRTEKGTDLLINRGWVPVGENNSVPDYPAVPADPVTITARLRMATDAPAEPIVLHGRHMVRNVETSAIGPLVGLDLVPHHLQLPGTQPGSLEPVPTPSIEAGSYLSYGLQWLAFGVLAPVGFGYFLWSDIRERRRNRADGIDLENDAGEGPQGRTDDGDNTATDASGRPVATTASGPISHERLIEKTVRDRYGTRFDAERRRHLRQGNRLDY